MTLDVTRIAQDRPNLEEPEKIDEDHRVDEVERPILPFGHRSANLSGFIIAGRTYRSGRANPAMPAPGVREHHRRGAAKAPRRSSIS
ncbi:hypothetical protein AB0L65_59090 [Nonomuraea sp. NPDC052116]|uniref:hypothetical protein n=1 Tax=Nonomuraea sp. NPDC052116 TaxID=3155665 RepID=UPI003427C89E